MAGLPSGAQLAPRGVEAGRGRSLGFVKARQNRELARQGYSANWAARHLRAAPSPSFSRISSNFIPTSVRAA